MAAGIQRQRSRARFFERSRAGNRAVAQFKALGDVELDDGFRRRVKTQRGRALAEIRGAYGERAAARGEDGTLAGGNVRTESVPLRAEKTEPSPAETFVRETV